MTDRFDLAAPSLRVEDFDGFYDGTPPWEIGAPQPALAEVCDRGGFRGAVLDVGCGTGEHALMAAAHGLAATGIDYAPTAIRLAKRKAARRNLDARFVVGDALQLPAVLGETYDTVVDSALFHVFGDQHRSRYVDSLHAVMRPAGRYYMLGFSDQVPGTAGPRRLNEGEIRAAFGEGWAVESVQVTQMRLVDMAVPAWLAAIIRT